MGASDLGLLKLARDHFPYEVAEAQADFGNLERSNGGIDVLVTIVMKNCDPTN